MSTTPGNDNNKPESEDWSINEEKIDEQIAHQQEVEQQRLQEQRAEIAESDSMFDDMALEPIEGEDDSSELKCLNCSTPMKGPYCYHCGQPERHFFRFFPRVLWEMLNEAFDLDSKISHTIFPLMFSPGRLSNEYFAGRRARYVNPLRLYIVTSLLFFICLSVYDYVSDEQNKLVVTTSNNSGVISRTTIDDPSPDKVTDEVTKALEDADDALEEAESGKVIKEQKEADYTVTLDDGSVWHPDDNPIVFADWLDPETNTTINHFLYELKEKLYEADDDPKAFVDEILEVVPPVMFFLLPIFALLLKIMFIFKKRYYMEHLVVALHSHSFIFLSLIFILFFTYLAEVNEGTEWMVDTFELLSIALMIWIPINLFLQQKRIYAQGKFMTFIKFVAIGISYKFLLTLGAAVAVVWGLKNL